MERSGSTCGDHDRTLYFRVGEKIHKRKLCWQMAVQGPPSANPAGEQHGNARWLH